MASVVRLSYGEQVRSTRCLARIFRVMGYDGSEVITGNGNGAFASGEVTTR